VVGSLWHWVAWHELFDALGFANPSVGFRVKGHSALQCNLVSFVAASHGLLACTFSCANWKLFAEIADPHFHQQQHFELVSHGGSMPFALLLVLVLLLLLLLPS